MNPVVARRTLVVLPIAAVVAASATVRYAASRSVAAPWIAPDEMIYGLLGRSLWATGHGSLVGADAPFYGAYPLLVGLPLHALDAAAAISVIQGAQAILMSLAAAAAWAWCRPLAGNAWALVAGVLTACLPALAYSGLLMSEAAFLPAATLALWMMARAITRPSPGRQAALLATLGLATAARLQGVILVPILVTAAVLGAWFARDRGILARLRPTWIAIVALAALWIGARLVADGNITGVVGAYSGAVGTAYDAG